MFGYNKTLKMNFVEQRRSNEINKIYKLSEKRDVWDYMIRSCKVTPAIIEENLDLLLKKIRMTWKEISGNPTILDKKYEYAFLEKYKNELSWDILTQAIVSHETIDAEFIEKFGHMLIWDTRDCDRQEKHSKLVEHASITMDMIYKYKPRMISDHSVMNNPNFNFEFVLNHLHVEWILNDVLLKHENLTLNELEILRNIPGNDYCCSLQVALRHKCVPIRYAAKFLKQLERDENIKRSWDSCDSYGIPSHHKKVAYKSILDWMPIFENPNIWEYLLERNLLENYLVDGQFATHASKKMVLDYLDKLIEIVTEKSARNIKALWQCIAKNKNFDHAYFENENPEIVDNCVFRMLLERDDVPLWFIEKNEKRIDELQLWNYYTCFKNKQFINKSDFLEKYKHKPINFLNLLDYINDDTYIKHYDVFSKVNNKGKYRRYKGGWKLKVFEENREAINWWNIIENEMSHYKEPLKKSNKTEEEQRQRQTFV